MIERILPLLIVSDDMQIIESAKICKDGGLTPGFEYLRNYLTGN